MLTTGAMVKIGKTYKNYMVDVKPTNIKLKDRAIRIVSSIANVDYEFAKTTLENNSYKVKEAIVQLKQNTSLEQATNLLKENNGVLRKIIEKSNK